MDFLTEKIFNDSNEMIRAIIEKDVTECRFSKTPPVDNNLTDSNKVFVGKVSILFVDMRNSTDFTNKTKKEDTIKTYRSLLKIVTYAIRLNDGFVRDYTGDGILAVFCDDENGKSETKAVAAGKLVHTLVCYSLNPMLDRTLNKIKIACGIGISTGTVSITKVGMRGRETDEKAENEIGTIWIGSCTNTASKLCFLAKPNEIVVDDETASATHENWENEHRVNGNIVYNCFFLSDCNLNIAEPIKQTPLLAENPDNHTKNVIEEVKTYLSKIQRESEEFGALKKTLSDKEQQLNKKEKSLNSEKRSLYYEIYNNYLDLLSSVFCKTAIIKECGIDYWTDIIQKIYDLGEILEYNKQITDKRICHDVTNIYQIFEFWEKAYTYLCISARCSSWVSTSAIERIVEKSGHYVYLKDILVERLASTLEEDTRRSLQDGLNKLIKMGY